jgi:nicotinamide-nucleotide amidase
MPLQKVNTCNQLIAQKKLTISFAESATAGRLSAEFAMAPESGSTLKGGIVCYNAEVKKKLLLVPVQVIEEFTAESAEVTKILADNLKQLFDSDIYVAITGLSAPGGSETAQKPVGTMFIHALFPNKYVQHREVFEGTPEEIIIKAIEKTADLITDNLIN